MAEFIVGLIERFGYLGIALLMAAENVFPPIPSELIMPFAGYVAAGGELHLAGVVAAGTAGSVAGTLPWYFLGRAVGRERIAGWVKAHGRWFTVTPEEFEKAERWFEQHGGWAVMWGRLVPAVRSVISLPAGIERMPLGKLLAWSSAGSLLWTAALAGLGFWLESRFEHVTKWMDWVSIAVLGGIAVAYVWRVVRFRHG